MDTRERLLVSRLMTRIADAPDAPKDADAQAEIGALLRVRPDAPYLLMQRTLMLEAALEQAQARLEQLSGGAGATAPQPSAFGTAAPLPQVPSAAAAATAAPAASAAGSFLRNAASIGAGVVGGGLLFQGIESLLHGGRGWGSGASQAPVEVFETNNYIQSPDGFGRTDPTAGSDMTSLQDESLLNDASDPWF